MNTLSALLADLYRILLGLYPRAYRAEFGEELKEVFEQAFQDSTEMSRQKALSHLLRELRDLPGVLVRTHLARRQTEMGIQIFPKTNDQTPWPTAILSLIPYVILGPLAAVISYHPWWDPEQLPWVFPLYIATAGLAISLSFIAGAVQKFPRWSYPSAIGLIFLFTFIATYLVNRTPWDVNHEVGILFLVSGLFILAVWRLAAFKPFLANLRLDWTTLSYGLYACTLLMTSTTDHDEVPSLNLVALLPSLIWLLGALVHLRIRSARGRTGVLVLSVLLGTAAWWSPVFQGMTDSLAAALVVSSILVTIWAVLVGLVLIPMVIGVFQYNRRVRGEPAS